MTVYLSTTPLVDGDGDEFIDGDGDTIIVGGGSSTLVERMGSAPGSEIYGIDLCVGWRRVAECLVGTFDGVIRNCAPGEWRLEAAVGALVFEDGYTIDDVDTIRVTRDFELVFAGHVAPIGEGVGGLEITNDGTGPRFTLTGPDTWYPLSTRLAYPDPSTEPPWASGYDERTGVASTVAAAYIAANLGADALPARQYGDVEIMDGEVGDEGTWTARLQPLHELVARICRDGGIMVDVTVTYDGGLRVMLSDQMDRTDTVVLSDQGDLVNLRRRYVPQSVTYPIAGGQGELTDRIFRIADSGATGDDRKEVFADWSTLASTSEVQQAARTRLAQGVPTWAINAELSDVAAQRLRFGDDYGIGDLVAVEIDNVRHAVPVEAVTVHIDPTRKIIRPVLGEAAPDLLTGLLRDVGNLKARFDTTIT